MYKYGNHLVLENFANLKLEMTDELELAFDELRKAGDYSQEAMENCNVVKVSKAHSGINVVFYVDDRVEYNAFARFPDLDPNHPFFAQLGVENYFSIISTSVDFAKSPMEGCIDNQKMRVSGELSKVSCPIVMGLPLLRDKDFTSREIATIFIHELGHHYSYFMMLGNLIRDSWIVSNAARLSVTDKDPEIKKKVLIKSKEQLGIETLDPETLLKTANVNRKDAVEIVLVSNSMIAKSSQSKAGTYDYRTIEQLADQFVAFHGGGRDLARSLVKLDKRQKGKSTMSSSTHLFYELMKTVLTLFLFCNTPFVTILWLLSMTPEPKVYQSLGDRVKDLKQQLTVALKNAKSEEEKSLIVREMESIDTVLAEVEDKRTFYQFIYDNVSTIGRRRFNEEAFQEDIKTMLFNEFQYKAQQLRSKK